MLEHGSLGDLVAWHGGLIGTGCVHDADDTCERHIVVASADGRSWKVTDLDAPIGLGPGSIRVDEGRLYLLGYGPFGDSGGAIVLTSVDGESWERVASSSFVGRAVRDVVSARVGAIAIGYNAPIDSDNSLGFVVWPVKGDGSFGDVRIAKTGSASFLVTGNIWMGSEFLAWGGQTGPYPSRITTLLASPDGTTWRQRGEIGFAKVGYVSRIVSVGDGLVAVGFEGARFPLTPRAWTSADRGRTWEQSDIDDTDARMELVSREGSTLLARGLASSLANERPASWASTDGRSWSRLAVDDDLPSLAGFGGLAPVSIGDLTCVAGTFSDVPPSHAAIYCRTR